MSRGAKVLAWSALAVCVVGGCDMVLFNFPVPLVHLESLTNPRPVKGWTTDGLILADGKQLRLPGVAQLPLESKALTEATGSGVEVRPDGRVFGLVRKWHWCGNDPVQFDLQRVDLSHLVLFFRRTPMDEQKGYLETGKPRAAGPLRRGGLIGQSGWNVSEFGQFRRFDREISP